MKGNISKLIELENGIFKVCQLQKNGVYAYVIEFENENDALKFCEEREGKGMYVWCEGNVAVYGNNEVIKSLKQFQSRFNRERLLRNWDIIILCVWFFL